MNNSDYVSGYASGQRMREQNPALNDDEINRLVDLYAENLPTEIRDSTKNGFHDGLLDLIPEVGMGATLCYPSDRYPCTITYVSPGKKLINFQLDHCEKMNGKWVFTPDTNEEVRVARQTPTGWKTVSGSTPLRIGKRSYNLAREV